MTGRRIVTAVVLAAAGVVAVLHFRSDPLPGLIPEPTPSASGGPASTVPPAPTFIPNLAFLQREDLLYSSPQDAPSSNMLPPFCGAGYGSDTSIVQRRTIEPGYWTEERPEGFGPDGVFIQTITLYGRDGASLFLQQLRAAVTNCPTETRDGSAHRHRLLTGTPYGDDSLFIEIRYPGFTEAGDPTGDDEVRLASVVRIGVVAMVLYERGWEAGSSDRGVVDLFTGKAMGRLKSWLLR